MRLATLACRLVVVGVCFLGCDDDADTGGNPDRDGAVTGSCAHPDAVGTDVPVEVTIESPADIAQLAGCTSVGGLDFAFGLTGVQSLAGLESLREVRMVNDPLFGTIDTFSGSVDLSGVSADLTDISALSNLERVEGAISIDAPGIREVDLSHLQTVGSSTHVLPGVAIGGDLIEGIDLTSLQTVIGDVHFTAENLNTLELPALQTISHNEGGTGGAFILSDADHLAILELPALTTVEDQFWIYWSDGITAIQAPYLTSVGDRVAFENNSVLTTIGLDTITSSVTGIVVSQNAALESIGLNGIPSVVVGTAGGGNVSIEYNPVLTTLGFASLTSIATTLEMCCNDSLPSEVANALRDRVAVGGGT